MEKIICDICGTAYPETEEKCPLCGCTKEFAMDLVGTAGAAQGRSAAEPVVRKKNKEIFDFDEVNQVKPARRELEEEDFDEDPEEEDAPRTNVFLVVILVILIVLLLLASGFFFLRYFLPNMKDTPVETDPVVTTMPLQTEEVTEDPGIPCTNLVIPGGKVELGKDGMWLLNVQVHPADTTDVLTYTSGDENVVTISADGTVTAVGEGQTVITITCGDKEIHCNVTVDYSIGEETVPTGTLPALQVEDSTDPTGETTAAGETQTTEEATEATEATESLGSELKLKKTDITISTNYTSVRLEMDCDIKPEDVKWFTMDSTVAICHDGVVTSTGSGLTRIYGEYNGQQVECIVRCIF